MMRSVARTTIVRLTVAVALLGSLGATACSPKVVAPVAPSATAPAATTSATPPSQPSASTTSAPKVDASGGAIGASLTVGSAGKSGHIGTIPRPSDKVALAKGVKALQDDGQIGKVKSVSVRSMTQDKKGRWWVLLNVTDDTAGTNEAVVSFDGKSWTDVAIGAGISNDDVPPDVRF